MLAFSGTVIEDVDSNDMSNGSISVKTTNALPGDRLSLVPDGTYTIVNNQLKAAGDVIGTFTGGFETESTCRSIRASALVAFKFKKYWDALDSLPIKRIQRST